MRAGDRLDDGERAVPAARAQRRAARRSSSAPTSTPCRRRRRSSRSSTDGIVRNAAGTILGADNKAAVAVMLEAARRIVEENIPHGGVELLFTPKEEVGLVGAEAFDRDASRGRPRLRLRPGGADRRDHPRRAVRARARGSFPRARVACRDGGGGGRSAIAAAARAIADLRLGRVDDETTANVGLITGGTAA